MVSPIDFAAGRLELEISDNDLHLLSIDRDRRGNQEFRIGCFLEEAWSRVISLADLVRQQVVVRRNLTFLAETDS